MSQTNRHREDLLDTNPEAERSLERIDYSELPLSNPASEERTLTLVDGTLVNGGPKTSQTLTEAARDMAGKYDQPVDVPEIMEWVGAGRNDRANWGKRRFASNNGTLAFVDELGTVKIAESSEPMSEWLKENGFESDSFYVPLSNGEELPSEVANQKLARIFMLKHGEEKGVDLDNMEEFATGIDALLMRELKDAKNIDEFRRRSASYEIDGSLIYFTDPFGRAYRAVKDTALDALKSNGYVLFENKYIHSGDEEAGHYKHPRAAPEIDLSEPPHRTGISS